MTYYIGIDWADKEHAVYIIDNSGNKVDYFRVKHNLVGLQSIIDRIHKITTDKEQILFGIETDKGLLVNFLLDEGFTVYCIKPTATDSARSIYDSARSISDKRDAMIIANLLKNYRDTFRPILPETPQIRELRILTRDHKILIHTRTRFLNQLTACLKSYYPVALELFSEVKSPPLLKFLDSFSTPKDATKLTKDKLKQFLKSISYTCPNRINTMFTKLSTPQIPVDDFIVKTKKKKMLILVSILKILNSTITEYEKEIENILSKHPDADIFLSLPGTDTILASRMLAEFGDNRDRYKSYNDVQCEAGTCPVTKQSGKYKAVHFRFACRKTFRDTMQLFSFSSMRQTQWAYSYYLSHRQTGKTHPEATRILANRWIKIIYTMWLNKCPYNEQVHLRMLTEHAIKQSKNKIYNISTEKLLESVSITD